MNKRPRVYVSLSYHPISHYAVFDLVAAAASRAGTVALGAPEGPIGPETVSEVFAHSLQEASVFIADVTGAVPNVMYEVGWALAAGKPFILIASSSRDVPFDLAGYRVWIYDLQDPADFVASLSEAITDAIQNPERFTPSVGTVLGSARDRVFISYSHADREYLDRLLVHLKPLERNGTLELWVDTRLRPGDKWKQEIEKALARASVAILLVSADFLASDFVATNELPPLLRSAEREGTRILPLLVKPSRFSRDDELKQFQAVNDPMQPLLALSEAERETCYDRLAEEVERTLRRA